MKMTPQERACLELIAERPGELGWYQLDRALVLRGGVPRGLMNSVRSLLDQKLISADGKVDLATTRLKPTVAGVRALESDSP